MPPLANPYKTSTINYDGFEKLFGKNVKPGMPLNKVFCVLDALLDNLFGQIGYDCVDLKKLGIECLDEGADKKCIILNWLIDHVIDIESDIADILIKIQILQTTIGTLKDEKVKVRAAGISNYLENLIIAPSTNIQYNDNSIVLSGFVPIGFRGTVNANRLPDFDATGKGKAGTDMWGWAIRNGNNGTINALGLFLKYVDDVTVADVVDGVTGFVVDKSNIRTFTLPVTGLINEALENGVKFKYDATNNLNGGPRPNGFASNHTGSVSEYESKPLNFKHSHTFTLNATHTNPDPVEIPLVPKHLKEIPIERIIP